MTQHGDSGKLYPASSKDSVRVRSLVLGEKKTKGHMDLVMVQSNPEKGQTCQIAEQIAAGRTGSQRTNQCLPARAAQGAAAWKRPGAFPDGLRGTANLLLHDSTMWSPCFSNDGTCSTRKYALNRLDGLSNYSCSNTPLGSLAKGGQGLAVHMLTHPVTHACRFQPGKGPNNFRKNLREDTWLP